MNADEAEPLDDQFADLLAAYEGALLSGAPTPAASGIRPPPELESRIHDALDCVHMLQQLWPAPDIATPQAAGENRGERYKLLSEHATGGIGQVWRACDADLDREVALKELRPGRAADPAFVRRFLHEARITGRLQHPGIVPVYELVPGQDGEPPFYTMRLVRGRTLTQAVRDYHSRRADGSAGPLDFGTLLTAFVSVCNTVAYAHSQNIIHRDLKSDNVVLGDFGEVVLLDWGFAKELGQPEELDGRPPRTDARPQDTLTGAAVGTPGYMAPEQAAGQRDRIDRRTDVYGLGAILYEILTGRPPFVGTDTREVLRQARTAEPTPPEQVYSGVPAALAAVCRRALAREPSDRYAAAAEVAAEVQRWLADEPTKAYRESAAERLRRWGRRHKPIVVGLTALVLTGFTAAMLGLFLLEKEQAHTAEVQVRLAREKADADAAARETLETHLYFERIALAERELAAHNLARATQLLDECPSRRRGWEWACLQRLCHVDAPILRGHTAPVSGAVFCLGGKRLVSAGHDRVLRVWDIETGKMLQTLEGHTDVIHWLAASPDGRLLASGSWDKTVRVWDAATGRELFTLTDHPSAVIRVVFGPDSRLLAAASGQVVKIWNAATGKEILNIQDPKATAYGLAISPDGRTIATGGSDNLIKLRDLATGAERRVLRGHRALPKHLAFSPDGRLLAAGDGDTLQPGPGAVKLWDVETGREAFSLAGHTYPVFSVAFSPDGRRLVSGSQDASIKVWDVVHGQLALTLRGHSDVIRGLDFSPDGHRLASASADRTVRIWDATPWQEGQAAGNLRVLRGHKEAIIGVGFGADGQVSSLDYGSILKLWDPATGDTKYTTRIDLESVFHSFAADRQGKLLACATSSGAVLLVDAATGSKVGLCAGFGAGPVKAVAFSRDGRHLATAEWRHSARIWDVAKRRPIQNLKGHTEPVVAISFGADDRLIATGSHDQTVKVWDAQTGKELRTLAGHTSRLTSVAFRPGGALLASAANDGVIKLWDAETGRELRELRGHTAAVCGLAFSPDGRWLASAGDDWTVKLWDVARGELAQTYRGHTGAVRSVAFDRDGKRLASGSQEQTVRLWQVPK